MMFFGTNVRAVYSERQREIRIPLQASNRVLVVLILLRT